MYPKALDINKIDITTRKFQNHYFNIIICNHVLEHVLDYKKAIKEIFRVLKKRRFAIVQTPFSKKIKNHFTRSYNKLNEDRAEYLKKC